MHPKTVYARVQDCDKAMKTLRGSGFEYMAQVKREERSRWIHERGPEYVLVTGMTSIYIGRMYENGYLRVNIYRAGERVYSSTFKSWARVFRFLGTYLDTANRIHVYAVGPVNNP